MNFIKVRDLFWEQRVGGSNPSARGDGLPLRFLTDTLNAESSICSPDGKSLHLRPGAYN
jgi:hypothetical protein